MREIQVKQRDARRTGSGARSRCRGRPSRAAQLWLARDRADEYVGTLVNAWLARGGEAWGVRAGGAYVDVGTLHGYREAIGSWRRGRGEAGAAATRRRRWARRDDRDGDRAARPRARRLVPQPRSRRRADRARPLPRRLSGVQVAALRPCDPGRPLAANRCSTSAATPASTRSR